MAVTKIYILLIMCSLVFGNYSIKSTFELEKSNSILANSFQRYDPPFFLERAKRARYLLHNVGWATLSTISSHYDMRVSPFSNVVIITDGPPKQSTGIPYMYVASNDVSVEDINFNRNVSITVSEMQTSYCKERHLNAELPFCAHLTLIGQFEEVSSLDERKFALNALFSRFPAMKFMPKSHGFFPAKLNIKLVWLLDFLGGPSIIPVKEYLDANP